MAERLQTIYRHMEPPHDPALRFTGPHGVLTLQQKRDYEENGFLVVKKLVPPEKLQMYRDRFTAICEGAPMASGMMLMRDVAIVKSEFVRGQKSVSKLQNYQNDEILFDYCALPQITQYVKSFTGPNIMAIHTMLINKPPDPGTKTSRHPMHQDLLYFPFRPADRIVASWTAMEHVHRRNGCLVVVPGTHQGELLKHSYPEWEGGVNKMFYGIHDYDPEQDRRVHVEMEEGDTVFFHPLLHHGSGVNVTSGFRKAISCHYAASDCEYINVEGTQQEFYQDEIKDLIARKMQADVDDVKDYKIKEMTMMKARLVAGEKINI